MGNEATELGNLATVKADASPAVSEPESPADVHTQRDFNDNEQLARLGKRQVLRVSFWIYPVFCAWLCCICASRCAPQQDSRCLQRRFS